MKTTSKRMTHEELQHRRDRLTGMLLLGILVALVALMMWLASITGTGNVQDVWPMMP